MISPFDPRRKRFCKIEVNPEEKEAFVRHLMARGGRMVPGAGIVPRDFYFKPAHPPIQMYGGSAPIPPPNCQALRFTALLGK